MEIKHCPGCNQGLTRLPVLVNGHKRDCWLHPDPIFGKCDYSEDGTRVHVEVIDDFILEKFQELVEGSEGTKKRFYDRWLKKRKTG